MDYLWSQAIGYIKADIEWAANWILNPFLSPDGLEYVTISYCEKKFRVGCNYLSIKTVIHACM